MEEFVLYCDECKESLNFKGREYVDKFLSASNCKCRYCSGTTNLKNAKSGFCTYCNLLHVVGDKWGKDTCSCSECSGTIKLEKGKMNIDNNSSQKESKDDDYIQLSCEHCGETLRTKKSAFKSTNENKRFKCPKCNEINYFVIPANGESKKVEKKIHDLHKEEKPDLNREQLKKVVDGKTDVSQKEVNPVNKMGKKTDMLRYESKPKAHAYIFISGAKTYNQKIKLFEGDNILGRDTGNGNSIQTEDKTISRKHFSIQIKPNPEAMIGETDNYEAWLTDASKNGTFINGCKVEKKMMLHFNDTIDIGLGVTCVYKKM